MVRQISTTASSKPVGQCAKRKHIETCAYPAALLPRFRLPPCCAIIFLHTYPAVPLFFFALLLCHYSVSRFSITTGPCCALMSGGVRKKYRTQESMLNLSLFLKTLTRETPESHGWALHLAGHALFRGVPPLVSGRSLYFRR